MAKLSIKKNDYVMVIAGKDKGKTAHVLSVDTKKNRATIEGKGITVVKKAVKARKASDKSGIIDMPSTIDLSNIMPICASCDKPTRVGSSVVDGKRQRVCKKCGSVLETKKLVEKKAKATVKKRSKKADEATADGAEEVKVMKAMDTVKEEVAEVVVKSEAAPVAEEKESKTTTKATATAKKRTKKAEADTAVEADGAEEVSVMKAMDTVSEEVAEVVVKTEDKQTDKE